jgi:galactitol PTS system EIIA component
VLKLQESFIVLNYLAADSDAVIRELSGRLHEAGAVSADYGDATIAREQKHATGLPTTPFPIAFPHADADGVKESALAVATLSSPVGFQNMADPDEELKVELVIMLANKSPEEQIQTLRGLAELFGQPDKLQELKDLTDTAMVVEWLELELDLNP